MKNKGGPTKSLSEMIAEEKAAEEARRQQQRAIRLQKTKEIMQVRDQHNRYRIDSLVFMFLCAGM